MIPAHEPSFAKSFRVTASDPKETLPLVLPLSSAQPTLGPAQWVYCPLGPVCYATVAVPYKVTTKISTVAVTTPMIRSLIIMVYPRVKTQISTAAVTTDSATMAPTLQ